MNKLVNKFVKVITIYGEEIFGVVIQRPYFVLHLETTHGIIVIDMDDVVDIIIIGEIVGDRIV